jgi:hypothetical protein
MSQQSERVSAGQAADPAALKIFAKEVRERANAQFASRQNKRLLSVPLTVERARVMLVQEAHWSVNRRDCWAFAQGLSPLYVKHLIWLHEEDELAGNKERGVEDHFALQIREGANVGLKPEDYTNAKLDPATRALSYAWIHLVKDSPWLKSVAACAALEISNSDVWVDGGGITFRMGKRMEAQLGIPFEKQVSMHEHSEVDVEHANMLMDVAKVYGGAPGALDLMMEGIRESFELESVWEGLLADMMEAIPAR